MQHFTPHIPSVRDSYRADGRHREIENEEGKQPREPAPVTPDHEELALWE
jgi:hypothetical protein